MRPNKLQEMKTMRVYLTNAELANSEGKELLELVMRILTDGKLDQSEVHELQDWLASHSHINNVAAITYLNDILKRINSDGEIDEDESMQLHLALERVVPAAHRSFVTQARKREEKVLSKSQEIEKEVKKRPAPTSGNQIRIQHVFAKVAGVTFPNDDGSERQSVLKNCRVDEPLVLQHDPKNAFSKFATKVMRVDGQQLGYMPEYLAERMFRELKLGYKASAMLKDLTGGTPDRPTRGANFIVFFFLPDVSGVELTQYVIAAESIKTSAINYSVPPPLVAKKKPWWRFW
jgi:hypothetical protein